MLSFTATFHLNGASVAQRCGVWRLRLCAEQQLARPARVGRGARACTAAAHGITAQRLLQRQAALCALLGVKMLVRWCVARTRTRKRTTCKWICTRVHARTNTHAHAHTHTCTHTHMHTLPLLTLQLLGALRALQPRLYSISSSPLECDGRVQATIAEVGVRCAHAFRWGWGRDMA